MLKRTHPFIRWRLVAALVGTASLFVSLVVGRRLTLLSADPTREKDCEPLQSSGDVSLSATSYTVHTYDESLVWLQRGGTTNDSSCLNRTHIYGVVAVRNHEDVRQVYAKAHAQKLQVSQAGVRHSQGGQAFAINALVMDMKQFNRIELFEKDMMVRVQPGATWHDIQARIHPHFAVKSMQSTDIFTVGGSISVNAHGMDHQAGALSSSIRKIRFMLPSGEERILSRTQNTELFHLVIGGYGMFGTILEADLDIVPNDIYTSSRKVIQTKDFPQFFETFIAPDKDIGLTYTHLSTAPKNLLGEAIVYIYTKRSVSGDVMIPPLEEVGSVAIRRLTMNLAKEGSVFAQLKWWAEKYLEPKLESCTLSRNQAISSGEACLVTRNEPMHDSVPYLKNAIPEETDILHEYFIPRPRMFEFITELKRVVQNEDVNLLNASVRVVSAEHNFLSYAPEDAFSIVLYINQKNTPEAHAKMQKVTSELIDATTALGGRFFLPYQLHYTKAQLKAAYPQIDTFFVMKHKYDPKDILTSAWYEKYGRIHDQ